MPQSKMKYNPNLQLCRGCERYFKNEELFLVLDYPEIYNVALYCEKCLFEDPDLQNLVTCESCHRLAYKVKGYPTDSAVSDQKFFCVPCFVSTTTGDEIYGVSQKAKQQIDQTFKDDKKFFDDLAKKYKVKLSFRTDNSKTKK